MILVLLVGVYALVSPNIRVTHSFKLTGRSARLYGALLIVLAVPVSFVLNIVYRLIVPSTIRLQPLVRPVANVLFLAIFMFGLAALCRDRALPEDAASSNVDASSDQTS